MNDALPQPLTLITIRLLTGKEPAIVVPWADDWWLTVERAKPCEIYALPDKPLAGDDEREQWAALLDPFWWMQLFDRDVTFWPVDVWSATVFQHIVLAMQQTSTRRDTFKACRWVWSDHYDPSVVTHVHTIWKRAKSEQKAA